MPVVLGEDGHAYYIDEVLPNHLAIRIGSKQMDNKIRALTRKENRPMRKIELNEITEALIAHAESQPNRARVFHRVAPYKDGIEIDLGDDKQTHVRVTAGKVEVVSQGSETLFTRSPLARSLPMPAETGNLKRLDKYLNLHAVDRLLLKAWMSYTLAHPKLQTTNYPILVLQAGQGSGKSFLCRHVIQALIDPNPVGAQMMPRKNEDFMVAANNAHLLCYDNLRHIKAETSDLLCVAATGGGMVTRQLFTNGEQFVHRYHVALVLSGIYNFVEQTDLAQRSLPLRLKPLQESDRKPESVLQAELEEDLPVIFRGLLDLIADVFKQMPDAKVEHPERMIEFSQWLAAMELAYGVPSGVYQQAYSEALNQAQLDSLLDHPLAAAIYEFTEKLQGREWSGTPTEFLEELDALVTDGTRRSRHWPQNASTLSRRITAIQAGFATQNITIELSRGKNRMIKISKGN